MGTTSCAPTSTVSPCWAHSRPTALLGDGAPANGLSSTAWSLPPAPVWDGNRARPSRAPGHGSPPLVPCLSGTDAGQRPPLSLKRQIQTAASQGRERMQRHRRSSQEATVQPWEGPGLPQRVHVITLFELFIELFLRKVEVIVTQSCPTLCDPVDCSPPGPPVHAFSKQKYWSGLLFPSPGDLPNSGIEPRSPALKADFLPSQPSSLVP